MKGVATWSWLLVVWFDTLAGASHCTKETSFNGTHYDLRACTFLDLSCPADRGHRPHACPNALLPSELQEALRALLEADDITSIDLRGAHLGAVGISTLAPAFATRPALRSLSLGSCRLGDGGLRAFASAVLTPPAAAATMLQQLDLSHNTISDDGVRGLVSAMKGGAGPSLVSLDLSWNAIGSRGGRYLGDALKENSASALAELRLAWNGLMDRGARAIGDALGSNQVLALLDLEYNSIKDEGAKALAKGLRVNSALTTILLDHNGVSNATLKETAEALASMPSASTTEARTPTRSSSGGGDEEDIEEISFDDDVEAETEAAAEAAEDAREHTAGKGGSRGNTAYSGQCIDAGPWACAEAGCPSDPLGCPGLAKLGLCGNTFGEVWDVAPEGVGAEQLIMSQCPSACGKCSKDEL